MPDDTVTGTSSSDFINVGYVDADGDIVNDDGNIIEALQGNDTILAGRGNDSISGGDGFDVIQGGDGDDTIFGGADDDQIFGDSGLNFIDGGTGDDTINGGTSADTIFGGADNDFIDGDRDDDIIDGGTGNDTILGGIGNDSMSGGAGFDVFIENGTDGADFITDFGEGDGNINDGNQSNNDFVDLSNFYNQGTLDDVNNAGGNFGNTLGLLRADAADGQIDGIINGDNFRGEIGNVNITLELNGNAVVGSDLTFDNTNVACFTTGALIKTLKGEVPIEDLRQGDRVLTLDCGYQQISWIGGRSLGQTDLEQNPKLRPIRIQAGALGPNLPEQDLIVSPQHRILIKSVIALRMFDTSEVLVAANKLLALPGIDIEWDVDSVDYFHMLFEHHQIVFSNGSPTESLFTGPEALKAISAEARAEIEALFPHICYPDFVPVPVRLIPEKGKQMKVLAQRLAKNNKPAQERIDRLSGRSAGERTELA